MSFWLAPGLSPGSARAPPPSLLPGPYLLRVVTAGVVSEPVRVEVECVPAITGAAGSRQLADLPRDLGRPYSKSGLNTGY